MPNVVSKKVVALVLIVLFIIVAIITGLLIENSLSIQTDRQRFIDLKATATEESARLSSQITPRLDWADTSFCSFLSVATSSNGYWTCTVDYKGTASVSGDAATTFKKDVLRIFQSSNDLFSFRGLDAYTKSQLRVTSTDVVATDKNTGLACKLGTPNSLINPSTTTAVELTCIGSALKSWYPSNDAKSQNSPGSDAWKQ